MNKEIITLIICVLSILFSAIAMLLIRKRRQNLMSLPDSILSENDKEESADTLSKRIYVTIGCLGVSVINTFIPDGTIKFMIPILAIIVAGLMFSSTMEEMDAFDFKKDDVDIYLDQQEKRKEERKEQKAKMEEARRQKREAAEKNKN